MDIRERMFEHTASFVAGWAAWIPLSIWIVALVHWMVAGEIEVIAGFAGITAGLLLGFLAIVPPSPAYSFVALAAISGTVALFPLARSHWSQKQLRAIDVEQIAQCYESITLRPDNVAAKFRLARLVFSLGYPGHALRIAESCLMHAPQRYFSEEYRLVAQWRRMALGANAFEPLACTECRHLNQPGNIKCAACGAPFLLHRAQGKVLPGNLGRRLMVAWFTMLGALAGSLLSLNLEGPMRIFCIVGLVMVALVMFLLAFRSDDRQVNA